MPRKERPLLLSPSRWPVRWRLAGVSAGLTFVILLVFAAGVGRLVENRLHADFRKELEAAANQIAFSLDAVPGAPTNAFDRGIIASDATICIVRRDGTPLQPLQPCQNPRPLPPPATEVISTDDLGVAASVIPHTANTTDPVFVQYARDHDELNATTDRLWLFLGVGVGGGALLAALAGLWIARRAMHPIAALTATAREIATTRDPSLKMPTPGADDEVAELALTLDSMLGELDAARDEAQQMVQAQREFVADASHELRTPLTSILANLELLHERLEVEPPQGEETEMVESALRSSRRMRRLVTDLLLLARADAGRVGERRPCDLSEIVEAAVAEVRPVANGHRLEADLDERVGISGNADELHRLIVNLLENAVRHTPSGSTVEISVRRRNGSAVLEVADDGPGIPPGMDEQVFSRFVRGGGPADVVAGAGTGLGLAIVRAVATSHGGEVAAGSSPAGGARFTVTLPAADEPAEAPGEVSTKV